MKTFEQWNKIFASQDFYQFNLDKSGILWLKIKSLIRAEILDFIKEKFNINLNSNNKDSKFKEIYELVINKKLEPEQIDNILYRYNNNEIKEIESNFDIIESELYKMSYFAWGGDATNSLDKKIVSMIKNTYKYDDILYKIENDISENVKNYTLSSWYNNWTTILTEHIFKSHYRVISAVGKIKSVDFFIDDIPIDLKITYFPKEFLKSKRKLEGLKNELTLLKNIAKEYSFIFDRECKEDIIKYQITQHIIDSRNTKAISKLEQIKKENRKIISKTILNKYELIKWLYEKQGDMRFGSENRIFIVLIDFDDFSQAWKLKRNFKLIKPKIINYLDHFKGKDFINNKIQFNYKQKNYKTLSDIIFITK